MATHREEYGDYFAVQTFGAITLGAPTLKLSCLMFAEMFQFEQSSVSELQFSNMLCAVVVFEKSISPKSMLGYPADSDRRPDIVIDGQPWEVKANGSYSRSPVAGGVRRNPCPSPLWHPRVS